MRESEDTMLDKYIEEARIEYEIPGIAAVVVDKDGVSYAKGFGFRNLERQLPVTPETIYGVASVTKTFTAVAIMQLLEEGKVRLEDPVKRYIVDFDLPGGSDSITLYHFLTHTSGLPPIPALSYCMAANTPRDSIDKEKDQEREPAPRIDTYDDLIDYVREADFQVIGEPGRYCSYSNDAYALLGAIVGKVTGVPYNRYVWEHILEPLEMYRSTFSIEQLLIMDNVSSLYDRDEKDKVLHSPNWQVAPPYLSCGWLKSSAMDLSNFVRMLINGGTFKGRRIISEASIEMMSVPRHEFYYGLDRGMHYGYGVMVQPNYGGGTLVSHGGNLKGVATQIGFIPEEKIGVIVLCNLSRAPAAEIFRGVMNHVMGLRFDYRPKPFELQNWPQEALMKVSGRFKSGEGSEVTISYENERLVASINEATHELQTTSHQSALASLKGQQFEIKFLYDGQGNVWAIGLRGRILRKEQST